MRNVKASMAAFLASTLAFAVNAHAACNVSISNVSPIPNVVYDPFEGLARTVNYTVDFTNSGSDSCSVGLAIASPVQGVPRSFKNGSNELRYTLEWPGGAVFSNNITSPIGSISVSGGKTKSVTLRVRVGAGLIAPASTYADILTFRLFRVSSGPNVAIGTDRTASAAGVVEPRAQVNIAGASGAFGAPFALDRLDFGTLTLGAVRSAIVQVRATAPVSINVTSANLGKLKHVTLKTDPGVPYSLQIDGASVPLGSSGAAITRSPPITLDGVNYPMSVQVGDVVGRPSGNYQDTLTVNVSPL
ncbi:MAG: hypothetical protein ABL973_08965 [Micropepsaceae bacterium]